MKWSPVDGHLIPWTDPAITHASNALWAGLRRLDPTVSSRLAFSRLFGSTANKTAAEICGCESA